MTALAADAPIHDSVRTTAWTAVLLLAVVMFGGTVMRSVFGPLQEAAKLDMKLSDVSISLVQGLGSGAPIALVSIPLAWVIDHGHRVRLLIILLAVCVVGTVWTAYAGSLTTLFVARMLASVGAGCAVAAVVSLVADLCAPDQRGRAIVILGLGTYAGAAAAFALGGGLLTALEHHPLAILGSMAPWRGTHLLLGLAGTVLILPLALLREPQRHEVELNTTALGPILRALWARRRFLAPLFVGQIAITMADTAASIWATPVLIRNYHQQPGSFALWVGAMILVGGVAGSVLGGFAADWGHKSGRRGGLLFSAVLATAIGVPAALFPVMPSLGGFQVLFFLLLFSGTVTAVVSSTTVAVLIPNEERGACMAAFAVINAVIGSSLAPLIVTWSSAAMGGESHLAPALAVTGLVTGAFSLGGYFLAMRNAPLSPTEHSLV